MLQRLLDQGWVDAIRTQHPDQPIFTFLDYFRQHWQRNAGLRIDRLLLSNTPARGLCGAGVDTWVRGDPHGSDHAPTWVEVKMSTTPRPRKRGRAAKA